MGIRLKFPPGDAAPDLSLVGPVEEFDPLELHIAEIDIKNPPRPEVTEELDLVKIIDNEVSSRFPETEVEAVIKDEGAGDLALPMFPDGKADPTV